MVRLMSRRANAIQPSATLELSARAKALKASGQAVLDLSVGEPDLPTPAPVVDAARRALDEGHFGYTPTPGVGPLREEVARVYSQRLGMEFAADQTMVSNGAKQVLFNAMATATDPGDRIGLLQPYWVSYVEQAHALGCEPVIIPCPAESGFRPDLDALDAALRDGLRLLVFNSPCNPTGAAYRREDWLPILERVADSEVLLLSDEIYEDMVYVDGGHVSPLHVMPELAPRCCVATGLSKSFAMTGWRVGFAIAPAEWIRGMSRLQSHSTSNINAVSQQAALYALRQRELVKPLSDTFRRRRGLVLSLAKELTGVKLCEPEGTFYLFLNVAELLGGSGPGSSVDSLAGWLLDEHLLAMVPGSAFGDPRHLRMSFAASDETLKEAFDRMQAAFVSL